MEGVRRASHSAASTGKWRPERLRRMKAARSLPGEEWTCRAVQRRIEGETGSMAVRPSDLRGAEQRAVHQPPVEVEPLCRLLVVRERVIRAEPARDRQARDEAVLLAVHR